MFLGCLSFALSAEDSTANSVEEFAAKVVEVADGDSIVFEKEGARTSLELYGIKCPELSEDSGSLAREYTRRLVLDKDIAVLILGEDKEGRILGDIRRGSGNCMSALLVKAGFARLNPEQPTGPALATLEQEARQAKKGLWREIKPIPDWTMGGPSVRVPAGSEGVIVMESDIAGNAEVADEAGIAYPLEGNPGSVRVPPGNYMLRSCSFPVKDKEGVAWRLFGSGGSDTPLRVEQGATVPLRCGPPFRAGIRVREAEGQLTFALELTGRGGERYYGLERNGRRSAPPQFEVRDSKGEVVASGRFKYG
jgi:endonuclease YncB( thermonuclease family)